MAVANGTMERRVARSPLVLWMRRSGLPYLLILPSVLMLIMLEGIPVVQAIWTSLQRQLLTRPDLFGWAGLANYSRALFGEKIFWGSLLRTLEFALGSLVGAFIVGLSLALMLNQNLRGRSLYRALFLIPWVMPDVVTALIWKWMYNDQFGLLNYILKSLHLIQQPILFIADVHIAMFSIIIVQIWKLYPLTTVMLLAAMQAIPGELYEAAMIDGASFSQKLLHITLPLIRPTAVLITLLMGIWTFNHFDVVYLLTGGGPADATMVMSTLVYNKAFYTMDLGYASSLGVLMLLVLSVIGVIYLRLYRTLEL
jgi:multiple sugar transport system permease protein